MLQLLQPFSRQLSALFRQCRLSGSFRGCFQCQWREKLVFRDRSFRGSFLFPFFLVVDGCTSNIDQRSTIASEIITCRLFPFLEHFL